MEIRLQKTATTVETVRETVTGRMTLAKEKNFSKFGWTWASIYHRTLSQMQFWSAVRTSPGASGGEVEKRIDQANFVNRMRWIETKLSETYNCSNLVNNTWEEAQNGGMGTKEKEKKLHRSNWEKPHKQFLFKVSVVHIPSFKSSKSWNDIRITWPLW